MPNFFRVVCFHGGASRKLPQGFRSWIPKNTAVLVNLYWNPFGSQTQNDNLKTKGPSLGSFTPFFFFGGGGDDFFSSKNLSDLFKSNKSWGRMILIFLILFVNLRRGISRGDAGRRRGILHYPGTNED